MRHRRIDLDSSVAAVAVAMEALRVARSQQTSTNGTSAWRNPDGTETVVGPGAGLDETGAPNGIIQWVGDTTPPGPPTGITCSSAWGVLYVKWDGTLAGGVPADFAYVSILVDGEEIARMFEAGTAVKDGLENGAEVEVSAVAYDSARDREGNLDPNASAPFGPMTVEIVDERAGIEAEVQSAAQKADAAAAKADSYQEQIEDVAATVNGVEQEVAGFSSQIQGAVEDASQALTAATEASQDLAGFKTTVSQTYETKADAAAAMAQEVLDRNSAIEQSASEITSTVSQTYSTKAELGAVEDKADAAQSAAESASSAASAAQGDLDGFKGTVSSTYATKTEVEQTAESIEQTVSETYQVKGDYATSGEVDEAIEQEVANRNSAISQSATQIQQTVSQTYLSMADAEADYQPKGSYATTAQLTQTAESINATVAEVSGTADSALAKASEVEQTAEGLTVTLTSTTATANSALSKANSAQSAATNAAKTATNFLKFDSAGLCVGNQTGTLGYNTLIKSGGMDIRNGTTVLASFTSSQIDLGKNSRSTTISMANGGVIISADDNSARFDSGFDGSIVIGGASTATAGGSHAALSVSRATITLNTVGMLDDGGVYVNGKAVQPFIGITGWTYIYGSLASGEFVRVRKMGYYLVVMQWDFIQASTTYWEVPNLLPSSMWPSEGVYAAAVRTDSGHYLTNNVAYVFVGGGGAVGFQCGNSQSGYNAGCVAWFTG